MIHYPYESLGKGDHGWLHSHFHFSFADYYNPKRMHFGVLRVINDDVIAAHSGFDTHPHRDMEIITYVRKGAITHQDSMGNLGVTAAGDVQVMSAGTGILHSEHNKGDEVTVLYQIWIMPNQKGVKPRWDQRQFPKDPVTGTLPLLVSGRAEDQQGDVLFIHQDAAIYGGRLQQGTVIEHPICQQAYILVADGEVLINNEVLKAGDGVEVTDVTSVTLTSLTDCEIVVIDVPAL